MMPQLDALLSNLSYSKAWPTARDLQTMAARTKSSEKVAYS